MLPLLAYLIWEIYWVSHVGYAAIKWHTHLAVYFYLWLSSFAIVYFFNKVFHFKDHLKYQLILISVFAVLICTEALLIATNTGATYSEKMKFGYNSIHNSKTETYYRIHKPGEHFVMQRPEFTTVRDANSLGYSDREWTIAKRKGEKRILCLGDSWTEGIGATSDSDYVSILRGLLRQWDTNYTVMNGGTSGDDPCVNYVNYRDRLAKFKPDIIIQTLSANDMNTDIASKGGMERFHKDGSVHLQAAPWWEPIYAISYISRLIFRAFGYNELLLKTPFSKEKSEEINKKAIDLFTDYSARMRSDSVLLIVAVQAYSQDYDLSPVIHHLLTLDNVRVYDMMPYYTAEMSQKENRSTKYYWPQDGHHTPAGYALMARSIRHAIDSFTDVPDTLTRRFQPSQN